MSDTSHQDRGPRQRAGGVQSKIENRKSAIDRDPRGYRRKWKRVAPERRSTAAASLSDVFARRRLSGILWVLLIVSLGVHAASVPLIIRGQPAAGPEATAAEGSYFDKVMAKERAKEVSKRVKDSITMPPPPPEPEAVVERALDQSLTGDVAKVTAGLLTVDLQKELTNYVSTNLKDDLAAAAKDIATGRLSEDEIAALHRKFQDMAHVKTVEWRQKYLEEHQEERASVSTTEWYERDVSRTLFGNMSYQLFRAYIPTWGETYCRTVETAHWGRWGFLALGGFDRKIAQLRRLSDEAKAPPAPSVTDAARLVEQVQAIRDQQIFDGRFTQWFSWESAVGHQIDDYFAHQAEALHARLDPLFTGLWEKADLAAQAYRDAAAASASDAAKLKAAQAGVYAALSEIQKAAAILAPAAGDYGAINQALRSRVLRGEPREKAYEAWVNDLVSGLSPLIRDFARGQFKKGIIVHKDGVDKAMEEFPKTIVPLIRRDVERLLPKKIFDRSIFSMAYANPYASQITGENGPPTEQNVKDDEAALDKATAGWSDQQKQYFDARTAVIAKQFQDAINRVKEAILEKVLSGDLLFRDMGMFVEGVDYSDKVQEKLEARAAALRGRGQDLAKLTDDGVPDTSAPLVALMFGASKGHGANLEPVMTSMAPKMLLRGDQAAAALISAELVPPPRPSPWGLEEQASVKPSFGNSPRFEGIPFLTKFPSLDGSLSDWGSIRPLILRPGGGGQAILVRAAWNYQGFFFGYEVVEDAEQFYFASLWQQWGNHNTGDIGYQKVTGVDWAYRGDYLQLCFDTLDARNDNRGEPHTQEFVVFPRGTESDPSLAGIERSIGSQRDAERKDYRGVKSNCEIFPAQPPPATGPDGSGPYRVTRFNEKGYTSEVFIARTLFKTPVFAPGWYLGFDCAVAMGVQPPYRGFKGQKWAGGSGDNPNSWGDLLLLGTDPQIAIQQTDESWTPAKALTPGHSYLLTVVDPDRNVSAAAIDTVLVSAETADGSGGQAPGGDVEVFVLNETKPNSGVFRGFVNTQPGFGRQVQGMLEVLPLQTVRFGYVDFANARGQRNVINEMRLPVVAPLARVQGGLLTAARE